MNETQYWKSKAEALETLLNHHQLWLHRDIMELQGVDQRNKARLEETIKTQELSKKVISAQAT